MAEPARTSALAGHLAAGRCGAAAGAPGVRIAEIRPASLAMVNGAPAPARLREALASLGLADEPAPLRAVGGDGLRLLWCGPDRYLATSNAHAGEALADALAGALRATRASAVDLGHARTVLRVVGAAARDVLAKGCPLDVDSLEDGDCAATVISHFDVLVHCRGADGFELYVARSFGLAFYEWLLEAADEFGVDVLAS